MTNNIKIKQRVNAYNEGSIMIDHLGDHWKTIGNPVLVGLNLDDSEELLEGCINTPQVCVSIITSTAFTMVLKLYGIYRSPFVRLVAAVLQEKQVPYELVKVDFDNQEHKTPEYLEKHPFGQIPYIVCDSLDFSLPKSQSIQ